MVCHSYQTEYCSTLSIFGWKTSYQNGKSLLTTAYSWTLSTIYSVENSNLRSIMSLLAMLSSSERTTHLVKVIIWGVSLKSVECWPEFRCVVLEFLFPSTHPRSWTQIRKQRHFFLGVVSVRLHQNLRNRNTLCLSERKNWSKEFWGV